MQPKTKIRVAKLQKKLNALSQVGTPEQRRIAVLSGLKIITERAVDILRANGWWITGTLAGSLTEEVVIEGDNVRGRAGTNLEYARRVELGFIGKDSLGRQINQRARPYLRRAFAEKLEEVVEKISDSLKKLILKNV